LTTIKPSLVLAFLCLVLLVGSALAATPTTELLYVQEGANILTYSVNNTTAVTKKLGTLNTAYNSTSTMTLLRSGSFLYVLGWTPALEYFTVYSLTSAGIPTAKPVQTLSVKPELSYFYIHPDGNIAYAMFSWTGVVNGNFAYASDIVLFTINPKTGRLTNTTKVLAKFPLSDKYLFSISGMSSKGTKLYTGALWVAGGTKTGTTYFYSTINAKSGALGKQIPFWDDDLGKETETSAFSDAMIAQTNIKNAPNSSISIFPNAVFPRPLIACTSAMLRECGDSFTYVAPWIHPSGKYLLFSDDTMNETPIVYINGPLKKLQSSGASIPGLPPTVAFSPDGLLVYAVEGSEILVYVFDPHSGKFTANSTINAPGVNTILPVQ
jgi:hypothetical protein